MAPTLSETIPDWADAAISGDLFCTGPWFRNFAATALSFGESAHFIQWQPEDGCDPIALAMKRGRAETFPYARLLESMTNYYSCGFGPLGLKSADHFGLCGLADALVAQALRCDGIRLGPLSKGSEFASICEQRLRAAGMHTFWTLAYHNWYATTEGLTFAQYLQRLASSFPATSDKRRQAFLRKGMGTISIATSQVDLQEQLKAYEQVYAESWKVAEPFPEFMPGLIRLAGAHGWLRLGILRVNDEPAAAQLWFVTDRRALIYKVAYVERFSKLSVGSMLTCALLEHVLNIDQVREVDFLSGDDAYKSKWMFARRDRHKLLAFNPRRWRGLVSAMRETLSRHRHARTRAPGPSVVKVVACCVGGK